MWSFTTLGLCSLAVSVAAAPYNETYTDYNINTNQNAQSPLDYSTSHTPSSYHPSPTNWREIPFYTILMDKFADGDPSNNDYFGTMYEWDWREPQLRYGGDLKGLEAKLDYLAGMGVRGIFASGTPYLNMPWQADSYSALDFTVLDPHWGTITEWQAMIQAVHDRGMYYMVDFTVGTMGDLIAWSGFENSSAPFTLDEYDAVWKDPQYAPWGFQRYKDFNIGNGLNSSCTLPDFWDESGEPITDISSNGCKASEFDQYGDMEAFGVHPDWQRQLSKFASVQDRLREWQPAVMDKLNVFSCMLLQALDFDAVRIDKSTQVTLDALATWTTSMRHCATALGKNNLFITGEITGGDGFGSLYVGRGRMPEEKPPGFLYVAANLTSDQDQYFLRDVDNNALDAVAFHYSIYRGLERFLGLDGNLQVGYDVNTNFVTAWNELFVNNDLINPLTGELDPRHMLGTSNFDIFRWPSLANGTQKSALGTFIASLLVPGIPLLYFGEEQNFYLYDNGANNYLYGRQAMTSTKAWQRHGCYHLGAEALSNLPLQKALFGCEDDWNSLDHFDPTSDSRRLFAQFFYLRSQYNALQDGFSLIQEGNWTYLDFLPGSNNTPTERGLWSVSRSGIVPIQNLTGDHPGPVWFFFTNVNETTTYSFDCSSTDRIEGPYMADTVVRNLFFPYENYTLEATPHPYYEDGKEPYYGCIDSIAMEPTSFKALVPVEDWIQPLPALTKFYPGHDARRQVESGDANATNVDIRFEFSDTMDCNSVTDSITFSMSSSGHGGNPSIVSSSVQCSTMTEGSSDIIGVSVSTWYWSATLENVPDGILTITITNPANQAGTATTGATDHLLLRKGSINNVMVFPDSNYDSSALTQDGDNYLFTHRAYGADMFRYSWNFAQNWTDWTAWEDQTTIPSSVFSDIDDHFWKGEHVIFQYWSNVSLSASTVVHADYDYPTARHIPRLQARGPFNLFGNDGGVNADFTQNDDGQWELEIMDTWPSYVQIMVFSTTDYFYGDTDGDGIMDRLPPNSVAPNFLNMTAPPYPHLAWSLLIDDSTLSWSLVPRGSSTVGIITYSLLLAIPIITGTLAVVIFMWSFYGIKYNKWGVKQSKGHYFPILGGGKESDDDVTSFRDKIGFGHHKHQETIGWPEDAAKRRKVIMATLEYELIDWKLKVKIGGLGVMSSLMGKSMTDIDLIWVIPKVGDIEYPAGEPAEPFEVIIFGETYLVEVETHILDNITYVILDSPVFKAQTKADPYPARMDDLSSAIFYSTWNQAIAQTIRRYPDIDIYHINDYHGALAPIYLLPKVIPVCLSLHNAEFQGLWPLRTKEEMKEVCSAFNISKEHCTKYVQFGNTFNLLHAAASFISTHQKSIGVAGVSDKYGKRSWARYPALWTLKHVDSLPNPDPSDVEALDQNPIKVRDVQVDDAAEAERPEHKRQAQEWAGIEQDPNADLFVFVGRWSKQKGVDLIADVMPSLLEKKPSFQLIAVGPVIDLYGRFAAEKLARLMELYPKRVFSKPEFTALPPYLFSGADFALIPSRDEPFGLVAVEFGRKGALGVGSRLGGLGLMPGWWFPVESSATDHMLSQFKKTIKKALKSTEKERQLLRARSAVQRFPVIEWRQRTEDFHKRSIKASRSVAGSDAWRPSDGETVRHRPISEAEDWNPAPQVTPSQPDWGRNSYVETPSPGPSTPGEFGDRNQETIAGPYNDPFTPAGHQFNSDTARNSFASNMSEDYFSQNRSSTYTAVSQPEYGNFLERANRRIAQDQGTSADPFLDPSATVRPRPFSQYSRVSSVESIATIVDEKSDSPLNKAIETFTDADGGVTAEFTAQLKDLTPGNSEDELCIEKFLTKSEEAFFEKVRKQKRSSAASIRSSQRESMYSSTSFEDSSRPASWAPEPYDGFPDNGEDIVVMTRLQRFMSKEIFGWPLYAFILAAGQMLSATSFQLTLLSGQNFQSDVALYILGSIFLGASIFWYGLFRWKPSIWILSAPWVFFGVAFFLIGLPSLTSGLNSIHDPVSSVATWCYAAASASAFAMFGLNFGEEAGAATEVWILRACIVQGSQQIWVAALWYWGNSLNGLADTIPPWWIVLVVWPLAVMSFLFAYLTLYGLPDYYRQMPPKVPNFYKTLFRRKLVSWFLASGLLRDYFLSGLYGRNWTFLWSGNIPDWQTVVLIAVFFIGVWALVLGVLIYFSKTHTWLFPIFAVGLGAPRWCQMLWGVTALAFYVPWGGSAGPYLSKSLWLWLGVLDAVQGVGLGMMLLQTLSRLHVCATLAFSQIFGAAIVMIARATAPIRVGPNGIFPNLGVWSFGDALAGSPIASIPFWIGLACQILIVVGYFWYYRKEQLSRP